MIKQLIKHQIFEMCIDTFFTKLSKNFNRIRGGRSIPTVGSFYRIISHNYGDEHYHNCFVKAIECRDVSKSSYNIVYVSYEYSTGNDIDDLQYDDSDDTDDDYIEIFEGDVSISDLFENDDIEFLEKDGVIALNAKYYEFYK